MKRDFFAIDHLSDLEIVGIAGFVGSSLAGFFYDLLCFLS